jgi:hypothetical protein
MHRAHAWLGLAVLTLGIAVRTRADDSKNTSPPKPDPLSSYDQFERQGFRIMVSQRVIQVGAALRNLETHLERTNRAVPDAYKTLLHSVTLWIEIDQAPTGNSPAHYVPIDVSGIGDYGVLAEKRGGIVIYANSYLDKDISDFCSRAIPGWLLHELGHAVHDQVLGLDNRKVKQTFAQAMERKLYDSVQWHWAKLFGKWIPLRARAYAATNQLEYFAELSTAYLNCCSCFYPFTREELRKHDPAGYALMEYIWSTTEFTLRNDMAYPVSLSWVGDNGRRHKLFDLMPKQAHKFAAWSGLKLIGENMLSDDEYQFQRPKAGESIWRLTATMKIEK